MELIYLNNAATAYPRAPGVAEAVAEMLNSPPLHPGRTITKRNDVITECRQNLAKMLGVDDPSTIVLTTNATHSLNLAIWGVRLKRGEKVVTTVTEHNSVLRPLFHLKYEHGVDLEIVGLSEDLSVDETAMPAAIDERTRLVVVNHASNVTGRINDVKRLFRMAHQVGAVTLLDASQTIGHLKIDAEELEADIIAFTGHKGLRGPAGTGGLYVRPDIELEPIIVGGTGVWSNLLTQPREMPTRLESGTPNMPALAGLAAALRWLNESGDSFNGHEREIADALRTGLREIPGVTIFDDLNDAPRVGIVSFRIDGWSVNEIGFLLYESFGIISRTGLHCAPMIHDQIGSSPEGTVRFSVSGFTSYRDIEIAINAVRRLAS